MIYMRNNAKVPDIAHSFISLVQRTKIFISG
jgi:hypothetical protein